MDDFMRVHEAMAYGYISVQTIVWSQDVLSKDEESTDEYYHLIAAHSWAEERAFRIGGGAYLRSALFTVLVGWLFSVFRESVAVARVPSGHHRHRRPIRRFSSAVHRRRCRCPITRDLHRQCPPRAWWTPSRQDVSLYTPHGAPKRRPTPDAYAWIAEIEALKAEFERWLRAREGGGGS